VIDSDTQDHHSSFIRKGINSFSSLRDRFSSDTSTESDIQSHRPSVIRKSISSMSSSLRGIRSSLSSRPSRDGSTQYYTSADNTVMLSNFSGRPRRNSSDHLSNTSSGKSSVPRLPNLDTIVMNARAGERFTKNRSPNTLFSMSIFDRLDGTFTTNPDDDVEVEKDEPITRQPSPHVGRFPVRIKRPDSTATEKLPEPRTSQNNLLTNTNDQDPVDWLALGNVSLDGAPEATRVPMQWIDRILETSVTMRDQVFRPLQTISDDEIKERLRRLDTRVYVFVPDTNDNNKPWPRKHYPDLETALKDLCTRFKPYYASFAAFTPETRNIQLFPPNFILPENRCLIPGTIIFNIQDALDNWYAGSPIDGPCEEGDDTNDSTTMEIDLSLLTEPEIYTIGEDPISGVYDTDSMKMGGSFYDDDVREPEMAAFAQHGLGSSEESLLTDDYDMTIASKMGFVP
ncbi:hypothetical protein F4774DRAFT_423533, partial [Daldinia eschscholtzii]